MLRAQTCLLIAICTFLLGAGIGTVYTGGNYTNQSAQTNNITNRSNSLQIDSAAQIRLDTSTQYEHTWEFSQDRSSYYCHLQDANLTDNSGTFQCHSKEAAEKFLNNTE